MVPQIISADRRFIVNSGMDTINGNDDMLSLKYFKPLFYLSWTHHTSESLKKVKEVNEKWICVGQVSLTDYMR